MLLHAELQGKEECADSFLATTFYLLFEMPILFSPPLFRFRFVVNRLWFCFFSEGFKKSDKQQPFLSRKSFSAASALPKVEI